MTSNTTTAVAGRRGNRATKIAIGAVALLLAAGGTAFAYWTQMGAGQGTAGTGSTVDVVVNQTSTVTGLYPGGPAQALSGTFDNPNAAAVTVGAVTASVTATSVSGCDASWYRIGGTSTPASQVLPSGNSVGSWSGLTIQLANESVNQDACKSATVTITYAVAAAA